MLQQQVRINEGMTVHSRDGQKLGKVVRCADDAFVIERGFFFPKDYVAHYEDIRDVQGDDVILNASKEDLAPLGEAGVYTETSGAYAATTASSPGWGTEREQRFTGEEARIQLAEEKVEARKAEADTELRVGKHVETEMKEVTVPVMREEVHIERVPVDKPAAPGEVSFKEETTTIPLHEEAVEIKKTPVIREELRVSKDKIEEDKTLRTEVRKEVADVERDPNKKY